MTKKIIDQYRQAPLPLKATIWFTLCLFLQKGIGFLITPFLARMLSAAEYGRASVFMSWENILLTVVTLSSPKVVMNLCVRYEKREKMLSSLMGYNLLLAGIWGILLLLIGSFVSRETGLSQILVIYLYLFSIFNSLISCWTCVKQYEYSYKIVVLETLLYTMAASFGSLFAVAFIAPTAESKILPQVLFSVIIGLIITISAFKSGGKFYDKDVWKYTFYFCVPLLPHYLSEIFLMSSDRIMIDRMCGSSDVAIYSIAYAVGGIISMVTGAINLAFAPYQYHKIAEKAYKTLAKNTNLIIAFVAFCLCGIMLFGREIVLVFGGYKYIDSIALIIPICLGVFFNYVFQLFARVQEYYEQKHTIVIASISCAVLNIVLNYIFIRLYGYKAAAYTTFVCYFAFCFLHYLFYRMACRKYVGEEIYDMKGLALISAALILASVTISLINSIYFMKYILLAIAIAILIWQRVKITEFIRILRTR